MADLKTKYMGLELRSPIIAGSCGLTSDVEKMVEMEKAGVGAVVLKSIFEEQINEETSGVFKAGYGMSDAYPEAEDYIKRTFVPTRYRSTWNWSVMPRVVDDTRDCQRELGF